MKSSILLATTCGLALVAGSAFAQGAPKNAVFTGIDATDDSYYLYAGWIHSFTDLDTSGAAIKLTFGGGEYDFNTAAGVGVNGDTFNTDLLIGYRFNSGDWQSGAFIGISYKDSSQSVLVPTNRAVGDETSVAIELELHHEGNQGNPVYVDLRGNYSDAFETYWTRGQLGYNFGGFVVGAETAFLGNQDFDQQRYGAFGKVSISDVSSITLSLGYADFDTNVATNRSDGIYGQLGFAYAF